MIFCSLWINYLHRKWRIATCIDTDKIRVTIRCTLIYFWYMYMRRRRITVNIIDRSSYETFISKRIIPCLISYKSREIHMITCHLICVMILKIDLSWMNFGHNFFQSVIMNLTCADVLNTCSFKSPQFLDELSNYRKISTK